MSKRSIFRSGIPALLAAATAASGQYTLVTIGPEGAQPSCCTYDPVVSHDGTKVLFYNPTDGVLDPTDQNGVGDLYFHDVTTGVHRRVNLDALLGPSSILERWTISGDGSTAAVEILSFNPCCTSQVYTVDLASGQVELVSRTPSGQPANGGSYNARLSRDGRYAAFASRATDLTPGDTNNFDDIFVLDRMTGVMELVSVSTAGVQGSASASSPSISDDGQRIVFESYDTTLEAPDTNFSYDIFMHDRATGQTTRLTKLNTESGVVESDCDSYEPKISADGSRVAFLTCATNLTSPGPRGFGEEYQLLVLDLASGEFQRVPPPGLPGLELCEIEEYHLSSDGTIITLELEYCDYYDDRTSAASSAERGGEEELEVLMMIDVDSGEYLRIDSDATGRDLSFNGHDLADESLALALTAYESLVPEDANEDDDIYIVETCSPPVIASQPVSDVDVVGSAATMHARFTSPTTVSYQWYFEGVPVANGGPISGADSTTLVINPVGPEHAGRYAVIGSALCGQAESAEAQLTLITSGACPGDTEANGSLDMMDIAYILVNWGACQQP